MPDVSIILVNWNTRDLLIRSLQSIHDTKAGLDVEVIVVDNASSDDSIKQARDKFPATVIIQNVDNAGFSQANNQGMAIATAPFFLLLNTDAFLHAGALRQHADPHAQTCLALARWAASCYTKMAPCSDPAARFPRSRLSCGSRYSSTAPSPPAASSAGT